MPLTIAHVMLSRGYGPHQRQTELLIKSLSRIGITQALICRDDSPLLKRLNGVMSLKKYKISGIHDPRFSGHFKIGTKYALVHAHDEHGRNWAFVHYLMFGVKYIITKRERSSIIDTIYQRTLFSWASFVVFTSSFIKKEFKFKVDHSKIITDSISELAPFSPNVKAIRKAYENRYLVGHFGPLINRFRGQSVLIEACRLLQNRLPQLIVLFIGSGDDFDLLKEKAHELNNVKFITTKQHIADYLAALDIYVNPVNLDMQDNVILDAMDLKIPVISTTVGCLKDTIINMQTGLEMNVKDAKGLADSILRIKNDPSLRKQIIEGGLEKALAHSPDMMAQEYLEIYTSLISKK